MISIRPMREGDIALVAAIETETLSPWSEGFLAGELRVRGGLQFVAMAGTCPVGWCCCRTVVPEAELCKIAVKKGFRRQGVASGLLVRLLCALREKEVTTLFLEVRAGNSGAVRFYRNHGFSQVGSRPGYYSSPPDSALLLRKVIV